MNRPAVYIYLTRFPKDMLDLLIMLFTESLPETFFGRQDPL